ncbi:MAG: MFS transporter [Marmoricola sp.]
MARSRTLTLALCAGYFLVLLDVTVVNVALPAIGRDLDPGGTDLAWVVDGYAVPLAALLLVAGTLGDRVGHRTVVLTGFAAFGLATLGCALAPTLPALVAARAVQGTGAALVLPGTLAMMAAAAGSEHERTRQVAVWAAVGGSALPAGPLLGGLLVHVSGWRSVFWINVPVIALAVVPVLRERSATRTRTNRSLDLAGAGLLVVAVGSAVTAIIELARRPLALTSGALAVLAVLALGAVERRARDPLLRLDREARGPLLAAAGVAGLMNLCALGTLFLLTQALQDNHGLGAARAGLVVLPGLVPLPLLAPAAGQLAQRFGAWRTVALGLLVGGAGFAGIAGTVHQPVGIALLLSLAVWGSGLGILTPAVVAAALHATPGAPGVASGASNTARLTGGALGVAVMGAVAGAAGSDDFLTRTSWAIAACAVAFGAAGSFALVRARRAPA